MGSVETSAFMPGRPPRIELLIKKHMVDKAMGNTRRYDIFHPSAWGYCLRKIAYQFYNEKKKFLHLNADKIDLRMERIYDNGHGVHARWQRYFAKADIVRGVWRCSKCEREYGRQEKLGIKNPSLKKGWECSCGHDGELEYEELLVKSAPEYNFEGHVDAVVDLRGTPYEQGQDNDVFVVDFKTIRDSDFSALRQAKYEHAVQTQIYMWLLDLKGAVVLYESKDTQHIKEMFVARDDAAIAKIKEEALWMVEVLRHGKLPNRPDGYSQSKFPCRFCEFRRICYA